MHFQPARLREARTNAGLTRAELGPIIGRSTEALRDYERSRRIPPVLVLAKIASALDVEISEFFTEDVYRHAG